MPPQQENTVAEAGPSTGETVVEKKLSEKQLGFRLKRAGRKWDEGPTRPAIIGQEEYAKAAGAEADSEVGWTWRVWPYLLIGDKLCLWIGYLILLLPGPVMGVLIGTATGSMEVLKFMWRWSPLPRLIPPLIKWSSEALGRKVLKDERNAPFLPHLIWLCLFIPALFAYALWRYNSYGFEWWWFFTYHFLRIGPRFRFFAHLHVLVHREGHYHMGLFKGPWKIFNFWPAQWFVGPFFGQVPNSYGIAHNKIHHKYDNGLDDVHTNLDLDRTKFSSFVVYTPRFMMYWAGMSPLIHFVYHKEWRLARKMFFGMLYYYSVLAAFFFWDWKFCTAILIYPFFEATIFFSGISYLWHCWVDLKDPYNPYVSSVTILKGHDNIWNEDYHVVHHDAVDVHWSLAPAHYEAHKEEYAKYHATIFEDTEEGALLFWMLSGNWDELANHFVDLNGKLTHAEKKALLLERARFTIRPDDLKKKN